MPTKYTQHIINTPQSEPLPGREKEMAENNAGGYSFKIDPWKQLDRFLILGAENGTYYVSERKLTKENAAAITALLAEDPARVVARVVEISVGGKAYKQDPAIFTLALAMAGDARARAVAAEALPQVCRTGTHLFTFIEYATGLRGWGRGLKHAVASWYTRFADRPADLAYQIVKYQARNEWSHADAVRLAHPDKKNPSLNAIFRYVTAKAKGKIDEGFDWSNVPELIQVAYGIRNETDPQTVIDAIEKHNLPREVIPTGLLNRADIWEALLRRMPMTAMIRNLATMTRVGVIKPLGGQTAQIAERLRNAEILRKARIHPLQVLAALITYQSGRGARGQNTWQPVPQITESLNDAFYLAFDNVEPTGKRIIFGLDVSGSMGGGQICGVPGLTPAHGTAAMAMTLVRREQNYFIGGFCDRFVDLGIHARMNLAEALQAVQRSNFGSTDCAVPMLHALQHGIEADAFVVLTDNETWVGDVHPTKALEQYRQKTGIAARLAVVGMTATSFSIADQTDPGQLDIVGFATDTPAAIADFIRGL